VRDEIASLDPPTDRTTGNAEAFRDLRDGVELDFIVAATATTNTSGAEEVYGAPQFFNRAL